MEDNENTTFFTFDSPKGQSSYIKVIGVGGGGGNAVNHMYRQGIEGVDFIVCNTDMKALNSSPVPNKIPLGDLGLGAGNKPERARVAAEAKADDIREAISHNTQMLFITAGMGGGTGTGAAPVIAEIAKSIDLDNDENKKILVVAIVTRPFSFEGPRRRQQAEAGIEELRRHVDSIIVINNDKLRTKGNFGLSTAFGLADDVLLTAAKGIAEIITESAYVNRDFQDVNTVMEHSGTALMGTGSGRGENRAHDAIEAATTSELLDDSDIRGAKNVLLYFSYSSAHELTMDELTEITDYVLDKTDGTADVIWGAGPDESLDDELKVILIATGFEKSNDQTPKTFTLDAESVRGAKEEEKSAAAPAVSGEMTIIHKEDSQAEPVSVPSAAIVPEPVQSIDDDEGIVLKQEPVQEPVAEHKAAPQDDEAHVFVLDDDTVEEPVRQVRNIRAGQPEFMTELDAMVDDIVLVEPEREEAMPKVEAEVREEIKPVAPVMPWNRTGDNDVQAAAERIRRIHEMLRSNPSGAEIVQGMTTEQISGEALYEGSSSSSREASGIAMRADGTVARNPYLYGNQPD